MPSSPYIEKQKALYKTLKPCYCEAIQSLVYFNSDGLNHLLYDKHRPRNIKEKHYRVALIDYIVEVITKAQKSTQETFAHPPSQLFILEWVDVTDVNGKKHNVKVVLRKNGNGNVHFWSIMQRKSGRKTKNPN